ncbi:hypothetical protein LSH36_458g02027 [Paralvinella palmiformis]|uniref:SUEL-type lectin domain-containing protein n=1 Tax=Paralvinella palmiformis TaxID=53620 RepID=A0AAD9JAQ2_9ANNE|nr:hypothetical protein LSH36_458g02027 [Paralvinella palmiformis]
MTEALYGRMEIGECVKADLGYMGCQKDVLQLTDRWCSGQRSCDVIVPTKDLDELNPCLGELRTYLRASYRCVKVAFGSKDYCSAHKKVTLHNNRGFLASQVAAQTGCGSVRTPWVIKALPGQTINLTLHDYGIWRLHDEMDSRSSNIQRQAEHVYGYVYETATGTNKTIAESTSRVSHLYLSQSNIVEVHVVVPPGDRHQKHFIIEYESKSAIDMPRHRSHLGHMTEERLPRETLPTTTAVGCADLNPPAHAWYRREGDRAIIGCHSSRQEKTWHLRCKDNSWLGVVGNCSAPEVSITIIIGIAVVFAALVLVIGTLYLRNLRKRKSNYDKRSREPLRKHVSSSRQYREPRETRRTTEPMDDLNRTNKSEAIESAHSRSASDVISVGTGNAYTHIWERPLPDPHGPVVTSDSDYASQSNYSGATRQSKMTGGYDVEESTETVYNPEPEVIKDVGDSTPGRRYFLNNSA